MGWYDGKFPVQAFCSFLVLGGIKPISNCCYLETMDSDGTRFFVLFSLFVFVWEATRGKILILD